MYKKKSIILLAILLYGMVAHGQVLEQFLTADQQFIKKTTDSVLFVVRQDYILRDTTTGTEYGRGGREYFGRAYGLVVLSEDKLWGENKLKMPWLADTYFAQYSEVDSIQPILSKTAIRSINGKEFREVAIEQLATTTYDSLLEKVALTSYPLKEELPSIAQQAATQNQDGWLVVIYMKGKVTEDENGNLYHLIYRPKPNFNPNSLESKIVDPSITTNVLGGIYFTTNISIGKMELTFAGVLNKRPINWYISTLPQEIETSSITSNDTVPRVIQNVNPIEDRFIKVKFLHKEGFPLKRLCGIQKENGEQTFCTNEQGIAEIPAIESEQSVIILNGVKAICGKEGKTVKVVCKYSEGKLVPKKAIKKCE